MAEPTYTLKSLVDYFGAVSMLHPQVETFKSGEDIDLAGTSFNCDPVMVWLEFPLRNSFSPQKAASRLDIQIQVLDQVMNDNVDLLEIQSKCDMILQWIVDQIEYDDTNGITFIDSSDRGTDAASGVTLSNHSGQKWAGVRYDLSIQYYRSISPCDTIIIIRS
jgi:hypothetical protein